MKLKIFLLTLVLSGFGAWKGHEWYELQKKEEYKNLISEVSQRLINEQIAHEFTFNEKNVEAQFSFDKDLEDYIKKQMRLYTSKAMAIVVMKNDTGEVLSLLAFDKEKKEFGRAMAILATHPSASLSKIVSAADLIENAGYSPWTDIVTRGKGTTLYKYQLKKEHRWNRRISLEKAFAYSNNAAFGKAAIHNSSASSLYDMALNFGFNKRITQFLKLPKSKFEMPEDQFNLAELASGFNRETMISPLHAAVFASIVANGGVFKKPKMLRSLKYGEKELLKEDETGVQRVLSYDAATQLAQLMEKTVEYGTAKRSFRRFDRKLKKKLEIGGKTGSITGGIPMGKRDWFSAYSKPKKGEGGGISVSVMCIQGDKWRAKSSYLAKNIIEYYYKRIEKLDPSKQRVFAKK